MNLNAEVGIARCTVYYPKRVVLFPEHSRPAGTEPVTLHNVGGRGGVAVYWADVEALMKARIEATMVVEVGGVGLGTFNYDPATQRWTWNKAPFGLGSRGNPLVPGMIAAADRAVYPFGSRVTLVKGVGVVTVGSVSQGIAQAARVVYVGDTGGAIKGELRFDLFQESAADRSWHGEWWCCVERPKVEMNSVRDVQSGLQWLGLLIGSPTDGIVGPRTVAAITEFQRRAGPGRIPSLEIGEVSGAVTRYWLADAVDAARR